jgi:hypothetical protein
VIITFYDNFHFHIQFHFKLNYYFQLKHTLCSPTNFIRLCKEFNTENFRTDFLVTAYLEVEVLSSEKFLYEVSGLKTEKKQKRLEREQI